MLVSLRDIQVASDRCASAECDDNCKPDVRALQLLFLSVVNFLISRSANSVNCAESPILQTV